MLKTIFADDEQDAINLLSEGLKYCCSNIEIIAVAKILMNSKSLFYHISPTLYS